MRKIIMIVALFLSGLGVVNATNHKDGLVNRKVQEAFDREFDGAKDVNWAKVSQLYRAGFVQNGQYLFAFYNVEGELVATTRNIISTQLPLNLQAKMNKDYTGYWISDLVEMSTDSGTSWFLVLENADWKLMLKADGTDGWQLEEKKRKAI